MTKTATFSAVIAACCAVRFAAGAGTALFDSNDILVAEFTAGRISIYDENFQFKGYLATGIGNVIGLDRAPNGDVIVNVRHYGVYDIATDGTIAGSTTSNGVFNPANIAVAPNGNIYAASQSGSVRELTPTLVQTGRTFGVADDYGATAVVPGNRLWVSGYPVGSTKVFDLTSGLQTSTVAWQGGESRDDSMKYSVETNTVLENDVISGKIYEYSLAGNLLRTLTPGASLGSTAGGAIRGTNNEYWEVSYANGTIGRWDSSGNWIGIQTLAGLSGGFALQWTGAASVATITSTPTWITDGSSSWNAGTNWSTGSAPSAPATSATFGHFISAPRAVTLASDVTVGAITFDSTQPYTIAGTSKLNLSSGSSWSTVTVTSGNHTITAPMAFAADLSLSFGAGAGGLTVSTLDGTGTVAMTGTGTLTVTQRLSAGNISFGTRNKLDLKTGSAVFTSSTEAFVSSSVFFNKIVSSAGNPLGTVGVITNSNGEGGVRYATFAGLAVKATDVLARYTYYGDTDLNGYVDGNDLANLLAGMNGHLTGWENGDCDQNGTINGTDLNLLLQSLAGQGAPFGDPGAGSGGGSAIPEPSSTMLIFGTAIPMVARRRR